MQTWPAFSPNEIDWFNVQAVSLMNIQHGYTSLSVTDRNGKISWMTIPEGQGAEAAGFSKPERKELPLRLPSLRLSDDFHSMLVRSQTSGHYFLVYARAISTQEPELGFLVATFDVSEILDAMVGELVGPQFNFMIRDIDAHLLEAGDFADDGSIVETGNIAFLGRNWSLQIQSRPARFDAGWLLGAAGVLMSLLVSWIFHKQLKGAVRLSVSQKRYQIASEAGLDALMIYQPASGGFVLLEANTVSYELFPSLKNRQLPHTLHYLMAFLGHPELTTAAKKVSDSGVPYETYVKVDTDATAADNACYQAKYQGRNRYVMHQPDGCGSGLNKESSVLHALQRAIQHGLFELHSQSIVPMHKEEQALNTTKYCSGCRMAKAG
ncbi:hypothetical protein [Alteromonas sp. RKMC-009]|uniref:hypothetical protein n=1 Tax=Alteromonas sp. RKMC-009 TaxID=2267264 RepID=UPI0010C2D944|nr:hypothetical protein [Alteromonas sp. RKMC-009]AYA65713.2 hypothetical protein DS731_17755 [Alteromonas sp. RKMC-009]